MKITSSDLLFGAKYSSSGIAIIFLPRSLNFIGQISLLSIICSLITLGAYAQVADPLSYKDKIIQFHYENGLSYLEVDTAAAERPLSQSMSRIALAGPNRVEFHCQSKFMNGTNIAWRQYGRDVGTGYSPDIPWFRTMFENIHAQGGNSVRWWLHTNASFSPTINSSGECTGLASSVIPDIRSVLDLAWEYNINVTICLFSFDLLQNQWSMNAQNNRRFLTSADNIRSYINNALTPMVNALKEHPALFCWEIFNEPEGMTTEFGWTEGGRISMFEVQRVVNLIAGAINRLDTRTPVSNGAWSFMSTTDVGGNHNYYRDDRLIAAGGDSDGTLDFYMVHYYDWAGTTLSPFHHNVEHWQLDKPLLVGEFYANNSFGVSANDLFRVLYERGYAGAWGWQYTESNLWNNMRTGMRRVYDLYSNDIDIDKSACNDLVPAFSADLTDVCVNGQVTFSSTSAGTIASYNWNFGSGANPATATGSGPHKVSYSSPGQKNVSLTIRGSGNEETLSRSNFIRVYDDSKILTISNSENDPCIGPFQYNATISPALTPNEGSRRLVVSSFLSDWDAGSLIQRYTIDSSGHIHPGTVANLNRFLHGSWQASKGSWVEFTAAFCSAGTASITSAGQSSSGTKIIEIFVNGISVGTRNFSAPTSFEVPVNAGMNTIRFENRGQDWIDIGNFSFNGLCADLVYTWYVNGEQVDGMNKSSMILTSLPANAVVRARVVHPALVCRPDGLLSNELVNNCTITDLKHQNVSNRLVYPNPTEGKLYLEANASTKWKIYTLQGLELMHGDGNDIEIGNLPAGVYMVEFDVANERFLQRILKK